MGGLPSMSLTRVCRELSADITASLPAEFLGELDEPVGRDTFRSRAIREVSERFLKSTAQTPPVRNAKLTRAGDLPPNVASGSPRRVRLDLESRPRDPPVSKV